MASFEPEDRTIEPARQGDQAADPCRLAPCSLRTGVLEYKACRRWILLSRTASKAI